MRAGSLRRDGGKGHLAAAANSLSSVTFVIVGVISACHHSFPLFQTTPRVPRGCSKLMLVHRLAPPTANSNAENAFRWGKIKALVSRVMFSL